MPISILLVDDHALFRKGLRLLLEEEPGMQVGGELMIASADAQDMSAHVTGVGVAVGPFIGYKHTFGFGLTLDAQGGVEYVAGTASDQNSTATATGDGAIPLINLNVGWSF